MEQLLIHTDNHFTIHSSPGSSARDFDFLAGRWQVYNRKLKSRLNNCNEWLEFEACMEMVIILNGNGNTDSIKAAINNKPFEGRTLRLFNPDTRLWSIYWADSNHGTLDPPVIGSFEKTIGTFYGSDIFEGKNILLQFNWDKTDPGRPVWSQAFSADNGKTWEWNWYMYFVKDE
jgi:hypothetical protein